MNNFVDIIPIGSKICKGCDEMLPLIKFSQDKRPRKTNRRIISGTGPIYKNYCNSCQYRKRPKHRTYPDSHPFVRDITKQCKKCEQIKPLTEYYPYARSSDGRDFSCKMCRKSLKNKWHISVKSTEKSDRNYGRKYKFGLTPEAFKIMYDAQSGLCGICGIHMDFLAKTTCVDHDHHTGDIRGILCQNCNIGIGHLKDNIAVLENAITYLKKHNSGFHKIEEYYTQRSKNSAKLHLVTKNKAR